MKGAKSRNMAVLKCQKTFHPDKLKLYTPSESSPEHQGKSKLLSNRNGERASEFEQVNTFTTI